MAQTGQEIIKSTYVCDPVSGLLVKRSDGDHNREYWERVNQGDVVSGMTQLWEGDGEKVRKDSVLSCGGTEESVFRDQIRVGKLSGDLTRDLFGREAEGKKEVKVGKLNTNNLFEGEVEVKREVKVGKINTKNLFENQEKEDPAVLRPKMKIGKLDTKRVFDATNENKENEANEKEVIVVGKLNTKNLFENSNSSESSLPKRKIKVGKINTSGLFSGQDNDGQKGGKDDFEVGKINADKLFEETMSLIDQEEERAKIKVGKLNVQESNLFENQETCSAERPQVKVGKISTKDLFENSPTEEKQEYKLYKPAVVKKINTSNLFQESQNEQQTPKAEIKVGKINPNAFLKSATETSEPIRSKLEVKVGKLNAKKMFETADNKEANAEKPKSTVGKINIQHAFGKSEESEETCQNGPKVGKLVVGKLVPQIFERSELLTKYKSEERARLTELNSNFEPKKTKVEVGKINPFEGDDISDIEDDDSDEPDFRVGKLKSSMFENQTEEPVKLRTGGRKLQKGNRISCLIENLHTGKVENDTSDEEEKLRDLELKAMTAEKEVFLGKERICSLQNMFSGQKTQWVPENKVRRASIEEDDGFLKAGKWDQVAAMKGKFNNENTEEHEASSTFLAEFEELKNEGLVGMNKERFSTGNIRQVPVRKQSTESTNYMDKKQLKKIGAKFEGSQEAEEVTKSKPERVIGKLKTKNIFYDNEKDQERREEPFKVGKLNTKDMFSEQETGEERQEQQNLRVGKLNTSNIFGNEVSQEVTKSEVRVGKINTNNIFGNEESQEISKPEIKVGKINTSNIFENSFNNDESHEISKSEIKVGKLKTNMFENPANAEESCESPRSEAKVGKLPSSIFDNPFDNQTTLENDREEVRVGKIDTSNVFKYPESETTRTVIKVGKLDTSKVFNPKEEADELAKTQQPKVGKLNRDKLFDQDDSDENKVDREIDTDIVPSGKVSESANAFLENAKLQHSSSGGGSSVKRSDSSSADMQRKYLEQMQRTEELKKQAEERRSQEGISTSKASVVVSTKMEEAKNSFFQSMMQCGSSTSSAQRLGTSIIPTGDIYHAHPVVTTIDAGDEVVDDDEDLVVTAMDGEDDDDDGCFGDDEDCLEDPVSSKVTSPITVVSDKDTKQKVTIKVIDSAMPKSDLHSTSNFATVVSPKVPPRPRTSPPVLPAGVSQEDWTEYRNKVISRQTSSGSSSSKGKQLFQQCYDRQEADGENSGNILQEADLELIEDEFEKLHREMMGEE